MNGEMETIEGNITEIDYNNKSFVLQSGDGKTEYKIYWKPQHDGYMVKQKVGYYEKPTIEDGDGGLLVLVDIHYLPRPENFPKLQKKGSGSKGYYGKSPEERKDIRLMACLKAATELATSHTVIVSLVGKDPEEQDEDGDEEDPMSMVIGGSRLHRISVWALPIYPEYEG